MNISEIRKFIKGVDQAAKHYFTRLDGDSYTVWAETERLGLDADDGYAELGWAFEIVRYTRNEFDDMPQKIEDALIEHPLISFSYRVDADPESGYILHTFSCEA
ncbi:MAG: hypothetical protein IJ418_09075 [Clostridia bacterium]|nr:hypothetical protein [Clostridia bacterium]